jgi:hypothetical protein
LLKIGVDVAKSTIQAMSTENGSISSAAGEILRARERLRG